MNPLPSRSGRRGGINAEWALQKTVSEIKRLFDRVENDYFRERQTDVDFVANHLLDTLTGSQPEDREPPKGAIVVAYDLSPADAIRVFRAGVKAIATDRGGRNSHTAIIARSLGIPAIVGLAGVSSTVGSEDLLIVDGYTGELLVCPDEETVRRYQRRMRRRAQKVPAVRRERELVAETLDGVRVHLQANIELIDEIPRALAQGAEGIGLYRTEFLYLDRQAPPGERDHEDDAAEALRYVDGAPITFRTFDLGLDKVPATQRLGREANPALGLRAIRLGLQRTDLLKTQLRGILRASVGHANVRIMFPMVSGLEEFREAKRVLEACLRELRAEGVPAPSVPVGAMVEMPSSAMTADFLAPETSFLSIGTNDLTQYTLAVDRVNQDVHTLFRPHHPAVLRLIRMVVEAGDRAARPVSICGELAGDPLATLLLLGLGVRELSMSLLSIPTVKRLIRGSTHASARELAARVLAQKTPQDVEAELLRLIERIRTALR